MVYVLDQGLIAEGLVLHAGEALGVRVLRPVVHCPVGDLGAPRCDNVHCPVAINPSNRHPLRGRETSDGVLGEGRVRSTIALVPGKAIGAGCGNDIEVAIVIHVGRYDHSCTVEVRIDGVLRPSGRCPTSVLEPDHIIIDDCTCEHVNIAVVVEVYGMHSIRSIEYRADHPLGPGRSAATAALPPVDGVSSVVRSDDIHVAVLVEIDGVDAVTEHTPCLDVVLRVATQSVALPPCEGRCTDLCTYDVKCAIVIDVCYIDPVATKCTVNHMLREHWW